MDDPVTLPHSLLSDPSMATAFEHRGFTAVRTPLLSSVFVAELNSELELVLRGEYSTGRAPDKTPKLIKGTRTGPLGFSGNLDNVRVLQMINVHKCSHLFAKVVRSRALGALVATLAGWSCGARVAQDQVWAKPAGAQSLVFHRDSPYFFFTPPSVVTVWLALDDMDEELGPLEYVPGSHRWGDARAGSASAFFERDSKALLHRAALLEGIPLDGLRFESMAGLSRGCISIHDGRCWHGSGRNRSKTRPRRGLGIHYIPANARFRSDAHISSVWQRYIREGTDELDDNEFPVVS